MSNSLDPDQSKKDSKDQESIQSSIKPVPGYQMGKKQNHKKHLKQAQQFVEPDLSPNCLQRLSADELISKELMLPMLNSY